MKKILIADDDFAMRELLTFYFRQANFEISLASDGREAFDLAHQEKFDLFLLDMMMPVYSGIDLIKKFRAEKDYTPILILTARDDDELKLKGLGLGADDYLDKTTPMPEIIIRAEGLIRRAQSYTQKEAQNYEDASLKVDFDRKEVFLNQAEITLTKREFDILEFLIQHQNEIVSRDELLEKFWGISNLEAETRTMDVLVGRLRKKLGDDYIKSKRGFGYYFDKKN